MFSAPQKNSRARKTFKKVTRQRDIFPISHNPLLHKPNHSLAQSFSMDAPEGRQYK